MSYASPESTSTKGGAAMRHKDNAATAIMIKQERHIRKLQIAVQDLLVTDKPAAWELILGESRYEEIKALSLLEPPL